jgi:HTH-type transcriptional regulator / antitoxin HipB
MRNTVKTSGQLGPLLKQLRVSKGLSQTALGAKIGLSQERISRIEGRPESITVDQLLTVMMALDAALSVEENARVSASVGLHSDSKEIW